MLQQRIGRMVAPERRTHRPDADILAAAMGAHERHHLMDDVLIVLRLHETAVARMGPVVAERIAVVGVDAEHLHAPGVDRPAHDADDSLAFVFPLVAAGGGKRDHRRTEVTVDDDTHFTAETMGIPVVRFAMHR
jgi:hypothetical protein